jgi:hypothetical protein
MPFTGDIEKDADLLIQNVARLFATEGDAKLVAVLSNSETSASQTDYDNWNGGTYTYTIFLDLPQAVFSEIQSELQQIEESIEKKLSVFSHKYPGPWMKIKIVPLLVESETWQDDARRWLSGEGISNQGRVRSSNIASRECDGLLFRSDPEIMIYKALKAKGLAFAPLPVFSKGGIEYSSIEPDFILVKNGLIMCIEIDGDTVHTETPAEANARTRILSNEGIVVERFSSTRCATP